MTGPSSFNGQSSHDPTPPLPTSSCSMRLGLGEEGRTRREELLLPAGLAQPSQTCRGSGTEQGNVTQPPWCPAHRRHLINITPSKRRVPAPACPLKGRGDRGTWWQQFGDWEVMAGGSQMSLFSARAPCGRNHTKLRRGGAREPGAPRAKWKQSSSCLHIGHSGPASSSPDSVS